MMDIKSQWPLVCDEYVDDGEYLWFSYHHHNGLYRADKKMNIAARVLRFPGEPPYQRRLYKSITQVEKCLILAPYTASNIAVYNTENQSLKMIPFETDMTPSGEREHVGGKFWTAMRYGSFLYMMGMGYPGILRFNLNTYRVEYITDWVGKVERLVFPGNREGYLSEGVRRGNVAYFPILCADAILKLNLDSGHTNIIELRTGVDGFNGIADDGTDFWIVPRHWRDLIRYSPESGDAQHIRICPEDTGKNEAKMIVPPFYTPIISGGNILLFPIDSDEFLKVDAKDNSVSVITNLASVLEGERVPRVSTTDSVNAVQMTPEGEISFIGGRDGKWYRLRCSDGHLESRYILAGEEDSHSIKAELTFGNQKRNSWTEDDRHSLREFTYFVAEADSEKPQPREEFISAGQRIYRYLASNANSNPTGKLIQV